MTRTLEEIADEIKRATGAIGVSIDDFVAVIPDDARDEQDLQKRLRVVVRYANGVAYENTMPRDMLMDSAFDIEGYFKREVEKARERIDGSDPQHVWLLHKARLLLRCVLNDGFTPQPGRGFALRNHVERIDKFIDEYKAARNAGADLKNEDDDDDE